MRPINKEEYTLLNNSLDHLTTIFKRMGIEEVHLSNGKPAIKWRNEEQNTDHDILERFCGKIDKLFYSLPKEGDVPL